jgi:hypothetical protein
MNYITPRNRFQTTFTSLNELISSDNAVRVLDVFVKQPSLEANSPKIKLEWNKAA